MTVSVPLVLLFTDFGTDGPYLGQMEAAVLGESLQSRVVNLVADAPRRDPYRAAYLLAALTPHMPPGCVVLAVVDPGVGGPRTPLLVEADNRVFLGPDNGLLSRVVASATDVRVAAIDWQPESLSRSFHGRDLFAPVAGFLSRGQGVAQTPFPTSSMVGADWPRALGEVIYIDGYGNAMTGLSAADFTEDTVMEVGGRELAHANTFCDVPSGTAFWYENSCGLVEIAVNMDSAAARLGIAVGTPLTIDRRAVASS